MTCDQVAAYLDAYVDGELDIATAADVERHLRGCQGCSRAYLSHQVLKGAIAEANLRYEPPGELWGQIRSAVDKESGRRVGWLTDARVWRRVAIAAMVAFVATLSWAMMLMHSTPSAHDLLAQEVVSSHLRSLMGQHLEDVASSDQHTVKPWFNGKLDFSPPVVDLSREGFPLSGGRLDYVGGRPAATLVYRRRQHVINLYIQPAQQGGDVGRMQMTQQGYHMIHWHEAGLACWAVSDVSQKDLGEFVELIAGQIKSGAGPASTQGR